MSGDGGIKEKVIRAYTEEMDIQTFGQSFEFLSISLLKNIHTWRIKPTQNFTKSNNWGHHLLNAFIYLLNI